MNGKGTVVQIFYDSAKDGVRISIDLTGRLTRNAKNHGQTFLHLWDFLNGHRCYWFEQFIYRVSVL